MKTYEWHGLKVTYEIDSLGFEGDGSLPGGLHYLGDIVTDIYVYAPDGENITELFIEKAFDDIAEEIMLYEEDMYDGID